MENAAIEAWSQHDFERGLHYGNKALAIVREIGTPAMIAEELGTLSHAYLQVGDCVRGMALALEALPIARTTQHPEALVTAFIELGNAEWALGDINQAEIYLSEAYAICQALDWNQYVYSSMAYQAMGEIALTHYNYDRAREYLREGVRRSVPAELKGWNLMVLAGVMDTMPRATADDIQCAAKIWGRVRR